MAREKNNEVEAEGLRKISVKTVCGKLGNPPDKGVKALMIVYGQAQGYSEGESDYGGFTALVGNFEAVNLDSGESFAAPKCFLPAGYDKMIAQRLKDGATAVDFAFEIGFKAPGPDSTVRYEYVVKPVRDPSSADPLAAMRKTVRGLPQLAAPGK